MNGRNLSSFPEVKVTASETSLTRKYSNAKNSLETSKK